MNQLDSNATMNQLDSRVAFALNSKAISMMGRSCFSQAAATLKDAVSILQQTPAPTTNQESNESLNDTLEKANSRVFHPSQESSLHVAISVTYHDGIVKLSDDHASNEFSLIRIQTVDIDREEALAVLFHNMAISWMYQAESTTQAKNLFQMSLSLLNKLHTAASCPFVMQRFVFLMKNTCNAYVQALEMTGQDEDAVTFKTSFLVQLDQAAAEFAASELFTCTTNAATPAA
jgi:hypothetical protein